MSVPESSMSPCRDDSRTDGDLIRERDAPDTSPERREELAALLQDRRKARKRPVPAPAL